jgi:hypothetical protein
MDNAYIKSKVTHKRYHKINQILLLLKVFVASPPRENDGHCRAAFLLQKRLKFIG